MCVYEQNCVCLGSNAELSICPTYNSGQVGGSIPLLLQSFSQSTPCKLPKHWTWCEEQQECSVFKHTHTHGNKAQSIFFPVDNLIQHRRDFMAEVHWRRFTTQASIQVGLFYQNEELLLFPQLWYGLQCHIQAGFPSLVEWNHFLWWVSVNRLTATFDEH